MRSINNNFGCLIGNFFAAVGFISQFQEVPIFEVFVFFLTNPTAAIELIGVAFNPIDLLFYAFAVYQGYRLSFRRLTQAEIDTALNSPI